MVDLRACHCLIVSLLSAFSGLMDVSSKIGTIVSTSDFFFSRLFFFIYDDGLFFFFHVW